MSERWHRAAALVEQIDRYTANSESDSTDWFGNSQERLEHSPLSPNAQLVTHPSVSHSLAGSVHKQRPIHQADRFAKHIVPVRTRTWSAHSPQERQHDKPSAIGGMTRPKCAGWKGEMTP